MNQCFTYEELGITEEKLDNMSGEELEKLMITKAMEKGLWTHYKVDDIEKENKYLEKLIESED